VGSFTKGIHFKDALHVAIALHAGCGFLVSFNIKDFLPASSMIKVVLPGDF